MSKPKIEFYSYNLKDAIDLASCGMEEGAHTWYACADFHIRDVGQYNPKHPAIKLLKAMEKEALKYSKMQDKNVKKLRKWASK
jgi:hypothetical protein